MDENSVGLETALRDIGSKNERHPFIKRAGIVFLSLALLPSVYASNGYKSPSAGQLVQYELVAEYSIQQITQTLVSAYSQTGEDLGALLRSATAVKAYAITYYTPYVDGRLAIASGLVSIPADFSAAYPVMAYLHGTALKNDEVPSYPDKCGEAMLITALFASHGYVAVMPDYLGQGRGTNADVKHPYLDAAVTATTVADMFKAVKGLSALLPVQLNNRLFICGLSQGGHSTMAFQRYIEASPDAQPFNLIASAPSSGPYFLPLLWDFWQANNPSNVSPIVAHSYLSYRWIYGFSESLGTVFIPPYDARVESIDDGTHDADEMYALLPKTMQALMQASFLEQVHATTHPFYAAMTTNITCDFGPTTPTRLYHAINDELVTYASTVYARDRMNALGATDLEIIQLGPQWRHVSGLLPFTLSVKRWFDSLRVRVSNDYDGDRKADPAIYNAASGLWLAALSSFEYQMWQASYKLGAGATPVPGDYDGDGITDMAVYRRADGCWTFALSSSGQLAGIWLGGPEYTAAPRDLDGDGKTDPVVYRDPDACWYGKASAAGYALKEAAACWPGCVPVGGDYDGDGKADPAAYDDRLAGGWFLRPSATGYSLVGGAFGGQGWIAMPADYDGDGKTDPAANNSTTASWQALLSGSLATTGQYTWQSGAYGNAGGVPVSADYDGDGKADPALYHQDTGFWQIFLSTRGYAEIKWFFGGPDFVPALE